ncbi:ABC transporter substrate-binding protein [Carnobacterium gallinarum]|uniref:ABC transporter substrate-binding protein n=1 Tax=Carnobacterium gallinarum TaxID=2749 RepID=UPI0005503DD9|nr:ABC transporter substrate-binding protein [Carnobacterium gallinarum]
MSMRKKGFIVGSTVALMMVLIGCVTNEKSESIDTGSEKNYSEPKLNLSFGTMPATDALPILVASQEGYFVDEGVTVDIQNFKSPKDRDMALRNGHLDGVSTDMIAFSTYRENEAKVRLTSASIGYFSLLSGDSTVTNLSELKGHSVSYFKNQAPHYFLDEAMKTVNLTSDDLEFKEAHNVTTRIELVQNKQVTATIVPDPFRAIGLKDGLTELAKSDDLDIKPNAFAFTEKTIQTNSEGIKAFYRAYNKGVDFIQNHDLDTYYAILEKELGYSKAIKESVEFPTYVYAEPVDQKQLEEAISWATNKGIFTKDWTFEELTSTVAFD